MIPLALLAIALQSPNDVFPDTPANHWVYECIRGAQRNGMLVGYSLRVNTDLHQGRLTRDEAADEFAQTSKNVKILLNGIEDGAHQLSRGQLPSNASGLTVQDFSKVLRVEMEALRLWDRDIETWLSACKLFAPELAAHGLTLQSLDSEVTKYHEFVRTFKVPQPGSALQQFSDVPPNHWAAKSVLDLRRSGILDGYPDGPFRG